MSDATTPLGPLRERHQRELKALQDCIGGCEEGFFDFLPQRIRVLESPEVTETVIPAAGFSRTTPVIPRQNYEFKAYEKKFYLSDDYLSAWHTHCEKAEIPDPERSAMIWLFLLHEFLHPPQGVSSYRYHHLDQAPIGLHVVDYEADALAILCYFRFLEAGRVAPNPSFPPGEAWNGRLARVIRANIRVLEVFTRIYHGFPLERLPTSAFLRYLTWHFHYTRALLYRTEGTTVERFALPERPLFDLSFRGRVFADPEVNIGAAYERDCRLYVTHDGRLYDHHGDDETFSRHLVLGIFQADLELTRHSLQEFLSRHVAFLGREPDSAPGPRHPLEGCWESLWSYGRERCRELLRLTKVNARTGEVHGTRTTSFSGGAVGYTHQYELSGHQAGERLFLLARHRGGKPQVAVLLALKMDGNFTDRLAGLAIRPLGDRVPRLEDAVRDDTFWAGRVVYERVTEER